MLVTQIIVPILSLVAIFLFGVQKFSKNIQQAAGEHFRALLHGATATWPRGLLLGTGFTALIQSSTATTVILASLANAGLISFASALPVIFGANIGTTVTSEFVALNLPNIAPYIILLGFFITYFGGAYKTYGKPVFYFGLIFFSLSLISLYLEPIRSNPEVLRLFSYLSSVPAAIGVGVLITAIIQSSSVTAGLALILTASGFLGFDQALGIVMGANIGTTATALLASLVMGVEARRVALAHFFFNVIGVVLFLPFFSQFAALVQSLGGTVVQQVANAHVLFNVICAALFLPLRGLYARGVMAITQ